MIIVHRDKAQSEGASSQVANAFGIYDSKMIYFTYSFPLKSNDVPPYDSAFCMLFVTGVSCYKKNK